MDYIYDIVLNFNDDYYEFYEWKQEDKIFVHGDNTWQIWIANSSCRFS